MQYLKVRLLFKQTYIQKTCQFLQNFSLYTVTTAILFKSYVQHYSQSSWYLVLSMVTYTTCCQTFPYLDVKSKCICDTKNLLV